MNNGAKISLSVVALVALWLFWAQALNSLRGDAEAVAAAEEAADAAEAVEVDAQAVSDEARSAHEAVLGGDRLLTDFAATLPEIAVHEEYPFRRWYEAHLMTPSELRVYNRGSSEETVSFSEPRYWTNNATCRPDTDNSDTGDGSDETDSEHRIRFDYCQPIDVPTAIIGVTDAEVELAGWGGDCRLALGWVFSRFMETTLGSDGFSAPSGHHLRAWVLPGSFSADIPQCVDKGALAALRAAMGVTWGTWPVEVEEGLDSSSQPASAEGSGHGTEEQDDLSVVVRFGLMFRPAHPDLCTGTLVGYPEDSDECPSRQRLADDAAARAVHGPQLSPRVCLPRLAVATLVQGGDEIVARHDIWPSAALSPWPNSLDECDIVPVEPRERDIARSDIEDPQSADSDPEAVPAGDDETVSGVTGTDSPADAAASDDGPDDAG